MMIIFKKELNEFLDSLIAYMVIGVFLMCTGLLIWVFPDTSVLEYGYGSMETFFSLTPYVFIFLIPAITMKSFAEEQRHGTLEIIYTLPIKDIEIVVGKYFASLSLVFFSLLPTLIYFFSLWQLTSPQGNIDVAGMIGSYVGLIFLGGVFCAIGVFASALTENQIVSFVLGAFLCFFSYEGIHSLALINDWSVTSLIIKNLSVLSHYQSVSRGVIDIKDLVYFLSVIILLLYITRLIINTKKG